jgi:hypothetical protein
MCGYRQIALPKTQVALRIPSSTDSVRRQPAKFTLPTPRSYFKSKASATDCMSLIDPVLWTLAQPSRYIPLVKCSPAYA